MFRSFVPATEASEWMEVSDSRPCPVCQATSNCTVQSNGEFACCTRIVCDWPVNTGGWLHRLLPAQPDILNRPPAT